LNNLLAPPIIVVFNLEHNLNNSYEFSLLILPDNFLVLPNVIDNEFNSYLPSRIEIERFRSNYVNFRKIILYTGGFENRKNIPMLLSAIKEINTGGFNIALVVTGLGSEKWKSAIAKENLDRKYLSFLGSLTNQELKIAYKSVDAVVYPSLSEGFGRSCIEAIACETPLICSDIPVFREVAGDYPFYFDPKDLQSLVATINQALTNTKLPKIQATPQMQLSLKLQDVMEDVINGN
jgi:glycosyltransferase involved in cell wall biosynthesis